MTSVETLGYYRMSLRDKKLASVVSELAHSNPRGIAHPRAQQVSAALNAEDYFDVGRLSDVAALETSALRCVWLRWWQ